MQKNCLLGVEMNLGHSHKTRFWYLLEVFSKFSDKYPVSFIGEYPSPPRAVTCPASFGTAGIVHSVIKARKLPHHDEVTVLMLLVFWTS